MTVFGEVAGSTQPTGLSELSASTVTTRGPDARARRPHHRLQPAAGTVLQEIIRQLQTTHLSGAPAWKGVWRDRTGKTWYVEACGQHAAEDDEPAVRGS